jgi:MFS transporter, BCD family, chlorophyll transporter
MLSGFVTFTTAARAGFLMGIWGIANMLGRALGSLMGGLIVDGMYVLTSDHFAAYALVFALEILMLVVALSLTFRLVVAKEEKQAEQRAVPEFVPEAT